jgi:hypothetical protein
VFTEARQCPVNPIALSGRYEAAIRALSPVYATPAHFHHQRAVEYHPIPQPYVYKPPPEDVTSFNTRTKRYQAYREWKSHDESIGSLLASSPQTVIHAWPQCIWKAVDENVHILDSAPRYQLQVHDRIICYGLMEGEWRLTNRVVWYEHMT